MLESFNEGIDMPKNYSKVIFIIVLILSMIILPIVFAEDSYAISSENRIKEIVKYTNIERSRYGLEPLTLDQKLVEISAIRVKDMPIKYDHERPNGGNVFDISYKIHGENLAASNIELTPSKVVKAWMDSESHREIILNPDFKTIGIGYLSLPNGKTGNDGDFSHYWVQLFSYYPKTQVVTGLKSSSTTTSSFNLKWNPQSSKIAYGYNIKIYNVNTKKTIIKNIVGSKKNFLNLKKLGSGNTYIIKVRTFNLIYDEKDYGSYSSKIIVSTKPKKPIIHISSSKKQVIIYWKKITKATGYRIYISSDKHRFRHVKTILQPTKNNIVKFLNTKIRNRSYYYKVVSFIKFGSKITYSDFSPIKSVRPL
jgi:hypothetical protein